MARIQSTPHTTYNVTCWYSPERLYGLQPLGGAQSALWWAAYKGDTAIVDQLLGRPDTRINYCTMIFPLGIFEAPSDGQSKSQRAGYSWPHTDPVGNMMFKNGCSAGW